MEGVGWGSGEPAMKVIDSAEQLSKTEAGVGLAVGAPLQHGIQQLPS